MKFLFIVPILLALAPSAFAQEGQIHVADAKARPTAPGGNGAVYMIIMNHGATDDDLTGLSTPIADKAEIHQTVSADGMTHMDAVADLPLKANSALVFAPGGLHVMLTGLKQPLKIGDSFPLTLNFAKAGAVAVTVSVQQIKATPKPMTDMPGMKM